MEEVHMMVLYLFDVIYMLEKLQEQYHSYHLIRYFHYYLYMLYFESALQDKMLQHILTSFLYPMSSLYMLVYYSFGW